VWLDYILRAMSPRAGDRSRVTADRTTGSPPTGGYGLHRPAAHRSPARRRGRARIPAAVIGRALERREAAPLHAWNVLVDAGRLLSVVEAKRPLRAIGREDTLRLTRSKRADRPSVALAIVQAALRARKRVALRAIATRFNAAIVLRGAGASRKRQERPGKPMTSQRSHSHHQDSSSTTRPQGLTPNEAEEER